MPGIFAICARAALQACCMIQESERSWRVPRDAGPWS